MARGAAGGGRAPALRDVVPRGAAGGGRAPALRDVVPRGAAGGGRAPALRDVVPRGAAGRGRAPALRDVVPRGAAGRGRVPALRARVAGAAAFAALLLAGSACGYAFTAGAGRLPAGAEQVAVRPLANRTGDAQAGALLAAALRAELARRGADGGPDAPARIEGEVEEIGSAPAGAGMWRLTLVVRARLEGPRGPAAEHRARRTEDYLAGVDPLETEGRRRIALGRAAAAAARELVERMEAP